MVGRRARPGGEPARPGQRPGLRPPSPPRSWPTGCCAGRDGDGAATGPPCPRRSWTSLVRRFQAEAIRAGDTWANFIDLFASLVGVLSRPPGRPGPARGSGGARWCWRRPRPAWRRRRCSTSTTPRRPPIGGVRPHCAPLRLPPRTAAGGRRSPVRSRGRRSATGPWQLRDRGALPRTARRGAGRLRLGHPGVERARAVPAAAGDGATGGGGVTDALEAAAAPDDLLASYRRRASEEIERRLPRRRAARVALRAPGRLSPTIREGAPSGAVPRRLRRPRRCGGRRPGRGGGDRAGPQRVPGPRRHPGRKRMAARAPDLHASGGPAAGGQRRGRPGRAEPAVLRADTGARSVARLGLRILSEFVLGDVAETLEGQAAGARLAPRRRDQPRGPPELPGA